MNSELIPLMVVLPLTCAVLLNVLHGREKALRYLTLACGVLFLALPLITAYGFHYFGGYIRDDMLSSQAVGIIYSFQAHQRILIFTLALVAYLAIVSYMGSAGKLSGVYLGFMMLGLGTCAAVLLTDDLFNLYVFLEITLISQTALVIATGTEESYKAAVKYLIIANIAGNCLLLGIAMILAIVGTLNISDMQSYIAANADSLRGSPVLLLGCGLLIFAWAYGSGLFPFHNIKAEMYATARPHAAGLMQTQTKFILVALGIIILRLFPQVGILRVLALYISMGAMVFGVIMALKQDNYQSMLSYHAISQAGYVASGLSIGTPVAIAAAIFHALNNALYKTALFIGCDCVHTRRGNTDFKNLGGLIQSIPYVGSLVFIAKLAISGVPPFNGFQSKLMLMVAAFDAGLPEVTMVMLFVSVLTFISMMKAFHLVYMRGSEDRPAKEEGKTPREYLIVLLVLVGLSVVLGFFPQLALQFIQPIADNVGFAWR